MPMTNKELLFKQLVQPHWDKFSSKTLELIAREVKTAPQIFISYAWPNQRYASFKEEQDIQAWLLGLYARLRSLGVKVLFANEIK